MAWHQFFDLSFAIELQVQTSSAQHVGLQSEMCALPGRNRVVARRGTHTMAGF